MSQPRPSLDRSEPLYQQVARNMRNDIATGVLRDGERLPSTRELAEEWDVSIFTIQEAMKALMEEGVIRSVSRTVRIVHAPEQATRQEVPASSPQVLLIGGYAGCGKTELGRILTRQTGWPILDKDTLTRPVVEAALTESGSSPEDRETETYVHTIRPREYESLIDAMTENVQYGNSAIVTAPFIREFTDTAWLNRIQASCTDMKAELTVVWVHCDADTMHTYLRRRGAARDTAKLHDWKSYLASINIDFRPPVAHEVIDNCASSEPLQDQAKKLIDTVSSASEQS